MDQMLSLPHPQAHAQVFTHNIYSNTYKHTHQHTYTEMYTQVTRSHPHALRHTHTYLGTCRHTHIHTYLHTNTHAVAHMARRWREPSLQSWAGIQPSPCSQAHACPLPSLHRLWMLYQALRPCLLQEREGRLGRREGDCSGLIKNDAQGQAWRTHCKRHSTELGPLFSRHMKAWQNISKPRKEVGTEELTASNSTVTRRH